MSPVWAIGGGTAAGKSTVARILREKGIEVWELDKLSRSFLKRRASVEEHSKNFWPQFLTEKGELDRTKLGKMVFRDWENLFNLNSVTHPVLLQEVRKKLASVPPSRIVAIEELSFLRLVLSLSGIN